MTPIDSLDSVLQAGLSAATRAHAHTVSGENLADARASILQTDMTQGPPKLLGDDSQKYAAKDFFSKDSQDPSGAADARLTQALRSMAERFQAGQAAQAATKDEPVVTAKTTTVQQTSGKDLAFIGSWVGAASSSAPVTAPATAPAPATTTQSDPAVTQPASTGTAPDSGSGTGSGTSTSTGSGSGTGTQTTTTTTTDTTSTGTTSGTTSSGTTSGTTTSGTTSSGTTSTGTTSGTNNGAKSSTFWKLVGH